MTLGSLFIEKAEYLKNFYRRVNLFTHDENQVFSARIPFLPNFLFIC